MIGHAMSGSHPSTIWTVFDLSAGGVIVIVLVVVALTGKDRVIKAIYRVYREQWTRDALEAARTDRRLPYRTFKNASYEAYA